MDPLIQLRKAIKNNESITLHDQSGTETSEISSSIYIKIGSYIYPRDTPTNYRSKRGAGDYYTLEAVWLLVTGRELSFAEYMQEARRSGIQVVSLVDKKDLLNYVEEDVRPEDCPYIDTSAPGVVPRKGFGAEAEEAEADVKDIQTGIQAIDRGVSVKKYTTKALRSRESTLTGQVSFTNVLAIAKDLLKELSAEESNPVAPVEGKPLSLLEQIVKVNQSTEQKGRHDTNMQRKGKGNPIIIVPAAPTASLTLYNVGKLLMENVYETSTEAKARGVEKESSLTIEHHFPSINKSLKFQIIDNASRLSPDDWERVVGVFIQGNSWQFKGWKWDNPAELLQRVKGYYLAFDDDVKTKEVISQWNVHQLHLNRSFRHMDATASFEFWSSMEAHLKARKWL